MISDPARLFDAEVLRRYEAAGFLARRVVRGKMRAERRSHHRGTGVEFADYRPLAPGDDWRLIDWHAYARWRQFVLKLYVEEEDLHVHLLLDCSASMGFGRVAKFDHARRILAGLAYLALGNLDRAAFVPLGSGGGRGVPPGRGRERFPVVLRAVAACPLGGGEVSLEEGVRGWLAGRPRKGLAVIFGDLFGAGSGDAVRAMDRIRHAGHELAVVQVLSPEEIEPPPPGEYEFEDCESGRVRRVVVDAASARDFRLRAGEFLDGIAGYARGRGVPFLRSQAGEALEKVLSGILAWA
jgi:uncharacterized protein (DUF58 family)